VVLLIEFWIKVEIEAKVEVEAKVEAEVEEVWTNFTISRSFFLKSL